MNEEIDLRVERGKQTRGAILTAAFQLLVAEGPTGLTAGKLAAKAGISKANLFHHFRRIDDVPFAVFEEIFARFTTTMRAKKAASVADYIYLLGKPIIEAPDERRKVTAALLHFYIRSAHDEAFRAAQEKLTNQFIETLAAGFEEVLGRPLRTAERAVAPLLVAMCLEGLGVLLITCRSRAGFKKAWRALADVVGKLLQGGAK